MRRLVRRLLDRPSIAPRPPTRLADADVLAIAGEIIVTTTGIWILDVSRQGDAIVWTVGTQNRGVNETVRIADETRAVLSYDKDGLR